MQCLRRPFEGRNVKVVTAPYADHSAELLQEGVLVQSLGPLLLIQAQGCAELRLVAAMLVPKLLQRLHDLGVCFPVAFLDLRATVQLEARFHELLLAWSERRRHAFACCSSGLGMPEPRNK